MVVPFQWAGQLLKVPLSRGRSESLLFFPTPVGNSIGLSVFAWIMVVTNTHADRHTDRPRYVQNCGSSPASSRQLYCTVPRWRGISYDC